LTPKLQSFQIDKNKKASHPEDSGGRQYFKKQAFII